MLGVIDEKSLHMGRGTLPGEGFMVEVVYQLEFKVVVNGHQTQIEGENWRLRHFTKPKLFERHPSVTVDEPEDKCCRSKRCHLGW